MSEARDKLIVIIQKERPQFTPEQCEANADEIIAELRAEARAEADADLPEPTDDESGIKERVKRKADLK